MSQSNVEVPFGDDITKTAQNLLAAAERLGEPASAVQTTTKGHFRTSEKIAAEAESYAKGEDKPAKKAAPAKKAPAKKTPAKKAAAKKTAAKKAPATKAAPSSEAKTAPDTTEAQE